MPDVFMMPLMVSFISLAICVFGWLLGRQYQHRKSVKVITEYADRIDRYSQKLASYHVSEVVLSQDLECFKRLAFSNGQRSQYLTVQLGSARDSCQQLLKQISHVEAEAKQRKLKAIALFDELQAAQAYSGDVETQLLNVSQQLSQQCLRADNAEQSLVSIREQLVEHLDKETSLLDVLTNQRGSIQQYFANFETTAAPVAETAHHRYAKVAS